MSITTIPWKQLKTQNATILFYVCRSPCLTCHPAATAIDIRCIRFLLIRTWIEMAISRFRARKSVQNLFILTNVTPSAAVHCSCSGNFPLENALWSGAAHISWHRRLGAENKWRAREQRSICMQTRMPRTTAIMCEARLCM